MAIQTTHTDARRQLASLFDQVTKNREVVIIRQRGCEDVAMIAAVPIATAGVKLALTNGRSNFGGWIETSAASSAVNHADGVTDDSGAV